MKWQIRKWNKVGSYREYSTYVITEEDCENRSNCIGCPAYGRDHVCKIGRKDKK